MKYPIGMQSFDQIREMGFVYVDKTDLVYRLATEGKIYFLSRPRRFGKSLLVSTLKHYFLGHKELFQGLAIESLEKDWLEYPVFHIDFNGTDFTRPGSLLSVLEGYVATWEHDYGASPYQEDLGKRFAYVLKQVHEQTGRRAVVLIDEYDKPLLDVLDCNIYATVNGNRIRLEDWHRSLLKGFYSVFKGTDEHLRFVLLTGVTKFSQISVFSGFNQPADISMDTRFETLCGITEEELYTVFAEPIRKLAAKYKVDEDEMKQMLKQHYDGYHFSDNLLDIYNPFSLLNCFSSCSMRDFWFASGTPTYLVRLLKHFKQNINELIKDYHFPEEFIDYKADVEQPLPMIFQSGYLTIKEADPLTGSYLLDFPNKEVQRGFVTLIASSYLDTRTHSLSNWMLRSIRQLQQGKIQEFGEALTAFLADIPYSMRRKDSERERERYFQYTFFLLLRMLSCFTVYIEKEQSQGRVDCIVEVPDYVYIFEFKLDGSAQEALRQIEEKGYARPYATDPRKLFRIGVNFSSETGTISEFMVE
ncbi:MAG: ATP-binding protein [Parabacteroides sp.]|nr:ATP-binding protein [Parabacteroides sp.]